MCLYNTVILNDKKKLFQIINNNKRTSAKLISLPFLYLTKTKANIILCNSINKDTQQCLKMFIFIYAE